MEREMNKLSTRLFGAMSAALFLGVTGSAIAAGGSEDGAMECAYAAIEETGRDYTHVTRSVRRNHAVEEFWLSTRSGDAPVIYCQYNRRDGAVEFIDLDV